jgi:DNA-binding MarR family transcriptional regulator
MATSREVAREAWRAMTDLFVEGEAHARIDRVCAELHVSPGMLKALMELGALGGTKMGELAGRWHCDASYVTSIADGLQDRGLAERLPHPTDRRVKMLVLTEHGTEVREHALARLWEPPSAFDALTTAELRQLRDLVTKLAASDPQLTATRSTQERAPHEPQ